MPVELKELPIDKIIIVENNPRQISQEDLDSLCRDIEKDPSFLQQRPSLINFTDGKYYCYAGCQRIKAQKVLGRKTAPCFIEADVPIKVQEERMLKDNLHRGKWDYEILQTLDFDQIELADFGFEAFEIGFDTSFEADNPEEEIDLSKFDKTADSYLNSSLRQIVLIYDQDTHKSIIDKLTEIGAVYGIADDNASVVMKLIEFYEQHEQ